MKYFITILSLLWSGLLYSHIYKIEKAIKNDLTIIAFSDFHFSIQPQNQINHEQLDDILALAKKLNAFVIIEDSMALSEEVIKNPWRSINKPGVQSKETLEKNLTSTSLLAGFYSWCYHSSIAAWNSEKKLAFMASFHGHPVSIENFLVSADNRMRVIKKKCVDENRIINNWYKQSAENYEQEQSKNKQFFDFFLQDTYKDKNLKEILQNLTSQDLMQLKPLVEQYSKEKTQKAIPKFLNKLNFIVPPLYQDESSSTNNSHNIDTEYLKNKIVEIFMEYDLYLEDPITFKFLLNLFDAEHGIKNDFNPEKCKTLLILGGGFHIKNLKTPLKELGYNFSLVGKKELTCDATYKPVEPTALHIKEYFSEIQ